MDARTGLIVPLSADPPSPVERPWNLLQLTDELQAARRHWRRVHQRDQDAGGNSFPSRAAIEQILRDLAGALFPMRLGPGDLTESSENAYVAETLDRALRDLLAQVQLELIYAARTAGPDQPPAERQAEAIVGAFAADLPALRRLLDGDVEAAYYGDPAARGVDEVLICYPGVTAIIHHRLAHRLHALGARLVARIIADIAHAQTGIDIHPGATIGGQFFIDHGTGVVIGETAIIGERVRLYQAVTLGARRFPTDEDGALKKGLPRHPIIEDDVVIYAGATILGRVTIGRGSTIGGNVWLTDSVPPGSRVNQAVSRQETVSPAFADALPG